MPGHTISGIIKQYNNMISDRDTIDMLIEEFNEVNGAKVPRVGQSFQIPILDNIEE